MLPIFITKQNVCAANFSSIYSVKVLLHKIQSCFTNCIVEFVNHSCLIQIKMQQFCYILWERCTHTPLQVVPKLFLGMSPFITNFVHFFFSQYVFSMFFPCLKWYLLFETFLCDCKFFPHVELP